MLAMQWERQGDMDKAIVHAQRTLAHHQETGHERGQAAALNALGYYHTNLGNDAEALGYCTQALARFERLNDREGQAATWDSLGYAHHHLGNHRHAIDCYRRSIELIRSLGDRGDHWGVAAVLTHLGETHRADGQYPAARAAWSQALDILTDLEHPDATDVRAKLHALDDLPVPGSGMAEF